MTHPVPADDERPADRLAANTTNAGQSDLAPPATCQDHPNQPAGTQTVRVQFDNPMDAEELTSVRISVDPGHNGIPVGTVG